MTVSILPPNVSDLERALELAMASIEKINIPISTLWNADLCPIEVLPFLAWALSVDMWREDWPEIVKRRVVSGSLIVHRQKGTRPAVERALNDLGVDVKFTEWFETKPKGQPGTFSLIAWVNENLTAGQSSILNNALYEQIRLAVTNSKNTRSHFTFQVAAHFQSRTCRIGSALAHPISVLHRETKATSDFLNVTSGFAVGSTSLGVALVKKRARAKIETKPKSCSVSIGQYYSAVSFIYRKMEARL